MMCISGIPINDVNVFGCQDRDFIERRIRNHTAAVTSSNDSTTTSFVVFKSTMMNRHCNVNDVYYTVCNEYNLGSGKTEYYSLRLPLFTVNDRDDPH